MKQTKNSLFQIKLTQRSRVLCVSKIMVDAAGSLFCWLFCSAAAVAATAVAAVAAATMAAADVATVTTAGLLSCCFCYAETMAVDVAADNHFLLAGGSFPLPLYILQDYNFVLIIHAA